jgi:hypothetical protein
MRPFHGLLRKEGKCNPPSKYFSTDSWSVPSTGLPRPVIYVFSELNVAKGKN